MISLLLSILCILAVFGIFFIINLIGYTASENIPIVITTLNEEETIEGELRKLIFKNPQKSIVVIDLGSDDKTQKIVTTLSLKYQQIRMVVKDINN